MDEKTCKIVNEDGGTMIELKNVRVENGRLTVTGALMGAWDTDMYMDVESIKNAVGLEAMIDEKAPGAEEVKYLAYASDKEEKLLENQRLIRTPVVRNGKKATVGYAPETWSEWE